VQSLTNENSPASEPRAARKRFTPQRREELARSYLESGLTQEQFVAREGISKSALSKWLGDYRRQGRQAKGRVKFRELPLPAFKSSWAMEISTPQHWTLRLAQVPPAATLQQLVGALPC